MNKKKNSTNTSPYPDEVIDRLARAFYPAILACWNSEEGQREFAAWQAEQAHISGKEKQEVPAGELPVLLIVCGFLQGASFGAHPVFVLWSNFILLLSLHWAVLKAQCSSDQCRHNDGCNNGDCHCPHGLLEDWQSQNGGVAVHISRCTQNTSDDTTDSSAGHDAQHRTLEGQVHAVQSSSVTPATIQPKARLRHSARNSGFLVRRATPRQAPPSAMLCRM